MADISKAMHSLHPYPCKFPSAVVRKYLQDGDNLLDPFCGSGTTLLEGALQGLSVFGFDCNPIAHLIAVSKIANLSQSDFRDLNNLVSCVESAIDRNLATEYELHEFPGKHHWFDPIAQQEFAFLLDQLGKKEKFKNQWLVVAVTISAIAVTYSNQDSETRYVAVKKDIKHGDVLRAFLRKLLKNLDAYKERGELKGLVREVNMGDIKDGLPMPAESVFQVVTSPPYANTMDYYLYHKQRMNLLGFDFKKVQSQEIGSRHEFSSQKKSIEVWNRDYEISLSEIGRVLRPNGHGIVIIGDSQVAGQHIDGGKLTLQIARSLGLHAKILESVPMAGKSRAFRASFQRPNKFEHVVEVRK
jgi:site-specific DNA-methyltransferase (cytosine-N4-specific)